MTYNAYVDSVLKDLSVDRRILSVCDYGCGDAAFLRRNAEAYPSVSRWVGIDYFSRFPEALRPKSTQKVQMIERASNEFDDLIQRGQSGLEQFDLVISMFSLHHFQYPIQEIMNQWSLVAPGGQLVTIDFSYENKSTAERIKNLAGFTDEIMLAFMGHHHRHHYTLQEASDLFRFLPFKAMQNKTVELEVQSHEHEEDRRDHLKHLAHRLKQVERLGDTLITPTVEDLLKSIIGLVDSHGIASTRVFTIIMKR